MKKTLWLITVFPLAAWAHPGQHGLESALAALGHVLSAPDHVAAIVMLGLGVAWLGHVLMERRRLAKRPCPKTEKSSAK